MIDDFDHKRSGLGPGTLEEFDRIRAELGPPTLKDFELILARIRKSENSHPPKWPTRHLTGGWVRSDDGRWVEEPFDHISQLRDMVRWGWSNRRALEIFCCRVLRREFPGHPGSTLKSEATYAAALWKITCAAERFLCAFTKRPKPDPILRQTVAEAEADLHEVLSRIEVLCEPSIVVEKQPEEAPVEVEPEIDAVDEWPKTAGWEWRPGEASFNKTTFPITGKPFKVLKRLSEARGQALTEDILLVATDSEDRAQLDQHLKNARKAIRDAFGLEGDANPIPAVPGSDPTAWKLDIALLTAE
ncbi:MAG: helix-turn-helix domain-containing protein [Planctomycetota bacterium]|nr:helix-turn-helix domain-containing protein [Planctomycetota bacterium]